MPSLYGHRNWALTIAEVGFSEKQRITVACIVKISGRNRLHRLNDYTYFGGQGREYLLQSLHRVVDWHVLEYACLLVVVD